MNIIRKPFKYTFFNATLILTVINLVFFAVTFVAPRTKIFLSMSFLGLHYKFYWQPVTYMFVHSDFTHLFFNMFALLMFGMSVEKTIGSKEFLLFYFVTGILDGVISIILYWLLGINVFLMGASGAIYALLLAYAVIFPQSVICIWGIIPVRAPVLVAIYAGIEIFSQLFSSSNVAHLTHLAGFVLAYFYFRIRMGINPFKIWKDRRW